MAGEGVPDRLKLAQASYAEVLDATKHQDDKIGRLLTAIAFLTGGALVFVNRGILDVRYLVGDRALPLPGLAFGAFLLLVALSVLELVLSLTTPLTLPGGKDGKQSHLYFRLIAGETEKTWHKMWPDGKSLETLRTEIEEEYVSETLNIAARADGKNARLTQAASFTLAAMLCFSLAVMLSVDVLISAPAPRQVTTETVDETTGRSSVTTITEGREALSWTMLRRLLVGGVLAVFALVMILQYRRQAETFSEVVGRRVKGKRRSSLRSALAWLAVAYPTFVTAVLMSSGMDWNWDCLVWASGIMSFLLLSTGLYLLPGNRSTGRRATIALIGVALGAALVPAASGVVGEGRELRLLAAVLSVALLLLPVPARAYGTRRRQLQTAAQRESPA